MSQFNIYTFTPKRGVNASFYYRLVVPLTTMEEMGLPVKVIYDDNDPSIPDSQRVIATTTSDVNVFYQPVSNNLLENVRRVQEFLPYKNADRVWQWPPSWVIDTDDNLFMVHPANPAYKDLGIRMPDGSLVPPSNDPKRPTVVGFIDDETGEQKPLFVDGQGGFNVAANHARLETYRLTAQAVDAMTTTTPRTAAYVREEINPKALFVSPNMVRFDHYDKVELSPHPGEIRILWQGSPTHWEDMNPLKHAFGYLAKKYPQIKLIFWGVNYQWASEVIPSEQYRYIRWCSYEEYKLRLATIGHDISICPLTNHKFNQSRSAIKFYEASVLMNPAATLAQRSGPYEDEILEGDTGLLFDDPQDFIEKMSRLIEDETLRRTLASNAKDWVSENRDAFKLAPKLFEFYRSLRAKKKEELQPPTEEQWAAHVARLEALELEEQDAETVPS